MTTDLRAGSSNRAEFHLLNRPRCRANWLESEGFQPLNAELTAAELPQLSPVSDHDQSAPPTRVEVAASRAGIYVRFTCSLVDVARLEPPAPSAKLSEVEHVSLTLRPTNDPGKAVRFSGDWRGQREAAAVTSITGERSLENVADQFSKSQPLSGDWQYFHGLHKDRWTAELLIPWQTLGLEAAAANLGIAVQRTYQTGKVWPRLHSAAWPVTPQSIDPMAAFDHAELLIAPEAAAPAQLSMHTPYFGRNVAKLDLGEAAGKADQLVVRTTYKDETIAEQSYDVAAGAREIDVPFELFRSHDKHTDRYNAQRIGIELLSGGKQVYQAAFPAGRHRGLCIDEPYGERRDEAAAAAYKDMSAVDRWRDDVVRKLPRLHRRDTNAGAPSDFCLYDSEGNLVCNMMASEAWGRLAKVITDRFEGMHDQHVAATCLIGQKSVTNLILEPMFFNAEGKHTYHTPQHEVMGPLSIIRYGGGSATCRAAALATLCESLDFQLEYSFVVRIPPLGIDVWRRKDAPRDRGAAGYQPQQPGPMSCVVVGNYGHDVMLDPTTLGFLAADDADSARGYRAVEDISSTRDVSQLRVGFGPDFETFAAVLPKDAGDWHEVHWLPSRGVFPELAPEEADAKEQPMSIGFAHEPIAIVSEAGEWSPTTPAFIYCAEGSGFSPYAPGSPTMRVRHDADGIEILLTSRDANLSLYPDSIVAHLMISADHNHRDFAHFTCPIGGDRYAHVESAAAMQTLCKHLSTEHWGRAGSISNADWQADVKVKKISENLYGSLPLAEGRISFKISWDALGLNVASLPDVVGINAYFEHSNTKTFLSPPRHRLPADPMTFADLYLNDPAVVLKSIDFGIPNWGDNTVRITLENLSNEDANIAAAFNNISGMQRAYRKGEVVAATIPAGESVDIELPCFIDPGEKMCTTSQKIELVIDDGDSGKTQYRSTWSANYTSGLNVYPGGYDLKPDDTPYPGLIDPNAAADMRADYLQQRLHYITARLPDLQRVTTRDGAPSDFTLRGDGVEFNLMQEGVMQQMADDVVARFDNDVDRVLGIFCFAMMPSVARHLSFGHRLMAGAGPLSVMRGMFAGAGGNCGYHTRVFTGLLGRVVVDGQPIVAHSIGVMGHVVTAFTWKGSKVIMDADVGHIMMTPDGSDFATIDEFRSNPGILTTASPGEIARYYAFATEHVRLYPGGNELNFPGVFPPGAPRE